MIHVYLDDSGDAQRKRYAVCGGIVGEAMTMTFSEALWLAETKHLSQPFRSTDCECQQGQFKDWEKTDCDALMALLVGVLNTRAVRPGLIGCAVPIDLFSELFPSSDIDDPFRFAVRHVLVGLVRLCRKNNERAKLWFESGSNNADILRAYEAVRTFQFSNTLERNRLAGISFGDKTLAPLQAADLAARECFKAAINRGVRPTRKPMVRLWNQSGMLEMGEVCLRELKALGGDPIEISSIAAMGSHCHMQEVEATPYSQTFKAI